MNTYRCKTSLGYIEIRFDPSRCLPKNFTEKGCEKIVVNGSTDFDWISGYDFLVELYGFNSYDVYVIERSDKNLWLTIQLQDSFYGAPEYLLEIST